MQKQAPTFGRVLVMVSFALSCFGLLLFLWLAFGGSIPLKPQGYRVTIPFKEGTQLALEADVRISGVPVGKVKTIDLEPGGFNKAVVELDQKYAPLPKDARAILRQKTLLGETYVELTPGSPTGPTVPEGGTLAAGQVSPTVELDEIFRAFDQKTRQSFQLWQQSLAVGVDGQGPNISEALAILDPFAQDTNDLLKILVSQQGAVQRLVRNTGVVFNALSERDGQLRELIENANTVFATTAERNSELQQTFIALPTFQREARVTLARLNRFARDTNPLITQLRPAARELSPTLIDLSATAPDLENLFRNLGPLITASRAGFPAAQRTLDDLTPLLAQFDPFLRNLNPALQFVGLYRRELQAFFANTVAATQATDTPGSGSRKVHYLRTTNPNNPENLAAYPSRIGTNRPNPYLLPGGFDKLGRPSLDVYENRHCGRGVPPLSPVLLPSIIPVALNSLIGTLIFQNGGTIPAPPCNKQGKFTFNGRTTDYPQVTAFPPP
ncbi:MAG: MlaD family protein [Solirubrobacteraceae bacterium]